MIERPQNSDLIVKCLFSLDSVTAPTLTSKEILFLIVKYEFLWLLLNSLLLIFGASTYRSMAFRFLGSLLEDGTSTCESMAKDSV